MLLSRSSSMVRFTHFVLFYAVVASAAEAVFGALFLNWKQANYLFTYTKKWVTLNHQPPSIATIPQQ
jgi:hypothetical protein